MVYALSSLLHPSCAPFGRVFTTNPPTYPPPPPNHPPAPQDRRAPPAISPSPSLPTSTSPPPPLRGLSLSLVQLFLRQLLDSLVVLRDAAIIHCDIKVRVCCVVCAVSCMWCVCCMLCGGLCGVCCVLCVLGGAL